MERELKMVERAKQVLDAPMTNGKGILGMLILIGTFVIGAIVLLGNAVILKPMNNEKSIVELRISSTKQSECIETLKRDVSELKSGQTEIQKDIKDILKAVR